MEALQFDVSRWPLVIARWPATQDGDEALEEYLGQIQGFLDAGYQYAMVTDATGVEVPITARQGALIHQWTMQNQAALARYNLGHAIVVSTPMMRAVLAAVEGEDGDDATTPRRVVGTLAEGVAWCEERLERAGALQDLAPSPSLPEDVLAGLGGTMPTISAVIECFDAPAWLVDAAGEVLFANRSARKLFPSTPPWLQSLVAAAPGEASRQARCVRINDAGQSAYLIVPRDEFVQISLPPSLDRVARLLAQGRSDKEISSATDLPMATVRTYVARIFRRLDVHSRGELMRRWPRSEGGS